MIQDNAHRAEVDWRMTLPMSLWCRLGWHKWSHWFLSPNITPTHYNERNCMRCNLREIRYAVKAGVRD